MIRIQRAGTAITIVDKGRFGNRSYGIPSGGAMDMQSAFAANSLVDNPSDYPLLELYQSGHQIEFTLDTAISLAGAQGDVFLNDQAIRREERIPINAGDILRIGKLTNGVRLYLAIKGGMQSNEYLGSKSPIPFYSNDRITTGDTLQISNTVHKLTKSNSFIHQTIIDTSTPLLFTPGPEWDILEEASQQVLLNESFQISKYNDRMGYKLDGPSIPSKTKDILSSSVLPGTIQLLPSGQLIVLMRNCQTTGGYPRIGQLYPQHINQLAQRSTGHVVQFERLDL